MGNGTLHFPKVALTLSARLPIEVLQDNVPGSVADLGKVIAKKIDTYVRENNLGYYPALSYFSGMDVVEAFLLDAIDQVVDVVQHISRQQLMAVLMPIFSSVELNDLRNHVYSLPAIRLKDNDAIEKLNQHYCANLINFELQVSLIQRDSNTDMLEGKVKKMILRWLTEIFEDVEITSLRLI